MKNILCFGDSITWGYNAETYGRFEFEDRWTGILQNELGAEYRIIEEGLNSRTTVFNDEFTPYREYGVGANVLPMILDTHAPLDLVVLMLGTNDLQTHRHNNAKSAAYGVSQCILQIMKSIAGVEGKAPTILLLSPPVFKTPKGISEIAFGDDIKESQALSHYYQIVAKRSNVAFLDAAQYVETIEVDGIHLDKENNKILGKKIANKVQEILKTI